MAEFVLLEAKDFVAERTFATVWPGARKSAPQLIAIVRQAIQAMESVLMDALLLNQTFAHQILAITVARAYPTV